MKQCKILTADWKEYLRAAKGKEKFDLVFLDPPYAQDILDDILRKLQESDILDKGAIIVCESDKDGIPTPVDGWNCKLYRYGKSHVTMMRLPEDM
jgi:16S rRNA G966 N2-methylase RsmD